jgi:hypothetical protein
MIHALLTDTVQGHTPWTAMNASWNEPDPSAL